MLRVGLLILALSLGLVQPSATAEEVTLRGAVVWRAHVSLDNSAGGKVYTLTVPITKDSVVHAPYTAIFPHREDELAMRKQYEAGLRFLSVTGVPAAIGAQRYFIVTGVDTLPQKEVEPRETGLAGEEGPAFGTLYREAANVTPQAKPWYLHEMEEGRVVRKLRILFANEAVEAEVEAMGDTGETVQDKTQSAIIERIIVNGIRGVDAAGELTFTVTAVYGAVLR